MLKLFFAEFHRNWLEFIRYPAEVIFGLIILIVLFYGFFMGASYIGASAPGFGTRLDSIIIGYVVWTLTLHSMSSVADDIQKEAQVGALQQVFLSSFGPTQVFAARTMADILLTSVITILVLMAIMILTGRYFDLSANVLIPVSAILLASFGVSFLMGALALWLKRVQQITNLGQFALLFLVMIPFEELGKISSVLQFALPIVPGVAILRDTLVRGEAYNWVNVGFAYASGLIYMTAGLVAFHIAVKRVKKLGTLGWY